MTRWILRPEWIAEMKGRIASGGVFEYTTDFPLAMPWIIKYLDKLNIPFKLFNLGAGVKKITTKVNTCPKCHGSGKI